jgi:hypothetical protein
MPSPFTIEVREVRSAAWLKKNHELYPAYRDHWRLTVHRLPGGTLQAHYRNCYTAWEEEGVLTEEAKQCLATLDEIVEASAKRNGFVAEKSYCLSESAVSDEVAEQEARAFHRVIERPEFESFRELRDRIAEHAKMTRYNEDRREVKA